MVDPGKGGMGVKVFFVWGATCAACALFAYVFIPETKGLTLEQVDRMMAQVSAPKSATWRAHDMWIHELSMPSRPQQPYPLGHHLSPIADLKSVGRSNTIDSAVSSI